MNRKGQLQVSFHSIFALVGGFLFLLFFFLLIKNVVMNEDARDTRQLSYAVEATIKTAATNPNEFRIVNLADAKYRFICDPDPDARESYIRINNDPYRSLDILDHIPLFAPRTVEGDRLFTLTQTWSAPFPVGSFVFLSNNRTQYVLVGTPTDLTSGRITNFIEDHQADSFDFLPVSSLDLGSLEVKGHNRYRFVFFHGGPDALSSDFLKPENSAIAVQYSGDRGKIDFYEKLKPTGNVPDRQGVAYYGDEMLLAAIFADNFDSFICNIEKATEHLDTTLDILLRRLVTIRSDTSLSQECKDLLDDGKTYLQQYRGIALTQLPPPTLIDSLEHTNNQLYANDCPTLY